MLRLPWIPASPSETWMPVISLSPSFGKPLPAADSAESIVAQVSLPSAIRRNGSFDGWL
ncbi:MAG TPA: hypothetical protein VIA45_14890 [Thermoanaerobaculia bacterium]